MAMLISKRSGFTVLSAVTACAIGLVVHKYRKRIKLLEKELQDEKQQSRSEATEKPNGDLLHDDSSFTMTEIGRIHSPFPQRAGCPRQGGTLAPHIRSRLIFHTSVPKEMLDGITSYSHVWIVFCFHLNPRGKASSGRRGQVGKLTATKIRPPRAKGLKVGVLATRAPHRPNPVGLSLGLVEKMEVISLNGRKRTCLVLRGLDLVDDTPVYDIKPYIPSDRVESLLPGSEMKTLEAKMKHVTTPDWVSERDELPAVQWSDAARDALLRYADELTSLYDNNVDEAMSAMSEIVAQDPRALHDGRGRASTDDFYFTFGTLRVSFRVEKNTAFIRQVHLDEGDENAAPGSYPHNLALRRKAEKQAKENGSRLHWENPVREGITKDLFSLKGGGRFNLEDDNQKTIEAEEKKLS